MLKPEINELILFIAQVLAVYIVIAISLYNLTQTTDNRDLWISLLSSSIGYLLPSPMIKDVSGSTEQLIDRSLSRQ